MNERLRRPREKWPSGCCRKYWPGLYFRNRRRSLRPMRCHSAPFPFGRRGLSSHFINLQNTARATTPGSQYSSYIKTSPRGGRKRPIGSRRPAPDDLAKVTS